jgi:hypothetical protein
LQGFEEGIANSSLKKKRQLSNLDYEEKEKGSFQSGVSIKFKLKETTHFRVSSWTG